MRVALAVLLLLALPASSAASTVRVTEDYGWCRDFCGKIGAGPDVVVVYDASPGEANRLTVGRDGHAITLTDPGAAVGVMPPCVALDAHTASCESGNFGDLAADWVSARLGDGDDSASVTAGAAVLLGGPGRDSLLGGEGGDRIDGGPGADRIDGGAGWNVLSFRDRRARVTVDLAAGRSSEGDAIANIKTVSGGHGRDRLLGGPGDDGLVGGGGDDSLRGRAGKDTLFGERGADRLDGGLGDDGLFGGAGADRLSGGRGADSLIGNAGADALFGGSDADALSGGNGADRLAGGPGRDGVDCGAGRDTARRDAKDSVHACEIRRAAVYTGQR